MFKNHGALALSAVAVSDVGSKANNVSWVGAYDMSGNIWQWTITGYAEYPYSFTYDDVNNNLTNRSVRGGSYRLLGYALRSTFRGYAPASNALPHVGFRCVRLDPPISQSPNSVSSTLAPTNAVISQNRDWQPVEQTFNGITMVLVPAGCFTMGSTSEQITYSMSLGGTSDWFADEQPAHRQCFDTPFWIDKYEVKQSDFIRLGGQKANPNAFDGADRPIEQITWFEARHFCQLRGARLPTEAEWEYAARGPSNWLFPWGNEWSGVHAVWSGNSNGQSSPVGSYPNGVSWVGAYDMAGNVWEWVSSIYMPYPYDPSDGREADTGYRGDVLRVMKGGAWNRATYYLRGNTRIRDNPTDFFDRGGFRCARSYN